MVLYSDKVVKAPATETSEPSDDKLALLDLSSEGRQIPGDWGNEQEANLIRSLFRDVYISLWGVVGLIENKGLDQYGNW